MIAAGIDFYSMLRYWPVTWDKWRCIGAAFVSVVGAPISAVVIGKRLQTQFGPEKVPLAMAIVPLFIAVPVGLFHAQLVMKPMAEQRETVCPVCMQVRQISMNIFCGSIIPFVIFPLAMGTIAAQGNIIKSMRTANYIKYLWIETKPVLKRQLPLTASLSAGATAGGVYFEYVYVNKILDALALEPDISDEIIETRTKKNEYNIVTGKFYNWFAKIKNYFDV